MSEPVDVAVCVVGAGPTGLALALDLGRRGVPAVVLEKRPYDPDKAPTANHVGVRAMEILRRWGVASRVRTEGFDPTHGDDRVFVTGVGGREVYRIRRPANGVDLHLAHTPEREVWCPKQHFDRCLEEAVAQHPSVALLYEHEVIGYDETTDGVAVHVESPGGETITVSARWLVACDGSHSTVRDLAGIDLAIDVEIPITLQSVDFRSRDLAAAVPDGWTHCTLLDRGAMVVKIDPVDRFRIHVPTEVDESLDPAGAAEWLDRIAGQPIHAEVRSVLPWRLTSSVASRFRSGRVLLAGDAAKRVTPYGGLGANYGIVDVATLGWMLAALEAGWGAPGLLDAYDAERRAAAVRLLEYQGVDTAADPPAMTTRLGLPDLPDGLALEGPAGDTARAEARRRLAEHNAGHFDNPGVDLDQRADHSPIVVPDGTDEPPWDARTYRETTRPGHRAPHRWLPDGRSTLDLYGGAGFVLWELGRPGAGASIADAAGERGVPLRVERSTGDDLATAYERPLVLVRPDGVVAWRGEGAPDHAGALIDVVRGASGAEA